MQIFIISINILFFIIFISCNPIKDFSNRERSIVWGVSGHPLSRSSYAGNLNTQIEVIKKLGFTYYRLDVSPSEDGEIMNASVLNIFKLNHIKLLPVLLLDWEKLSIEEAYQSGYKLGCGIADKYKDVFKVYEVGNEEDFKVILPNVNGDQKEHYNQDKIKLLSLFLKGCIKGIKDVDKDAKCIISNCGWLHWGYFDLLIENKVDFDYIGLHWYSNMGSLLNINYGYGNIIDILFERYKKTIWITEINKKDGSLYNTDKEQAYWINKYMKEVYSKRKFVQAMFIYELFDELELTEKLFNERSYGIVEWKGVDFKEYKFKPMAKFIKKNIHNLSKTKH